VSYGNRLSRLEGRDPGPECPECGRDPTAPVSYNIIWDDPEDDEAPEETSVSSPACPQCGYRALTVLSWDGDIVTDPEQVREERAQLERLQRERDEYLKTRPDLVEVRVPDYPPSEDGGGEGHRYEALCRDSKGRRAVQAYRYRWL
jgi:hypothetical protein